MATLQPKKKISLQDDIRKQSRNGYKRTNSINRKSKTLDIFPLNKPFSSMLNINRPIHYEISSAKSLADISCDSVPTFSLVKIMQSTSSSRTMKLNSVMPGKKYKLMESEKFDTKTAEIISDRLLEKKLKFLKDIDYEPSICRRYAQSLSLDIAQQLDEINFPNYRRVIIIHIGRAHNFKDIFFGSRCVWSKSTDRSICIHRTVGTIFGIVQIFAVL